VWFQTWYRQVNDVIFLDDESFSRLSKKEMIVQDKAVKLATSFIGQGTPYFYYNLQGILQNTAMAEILVVTKDLTQNKEFTARTTVTQYCGDTCAKRAYKARLKVSKIEASDKQTQQIKNQPFEELKTKEFLTVREVARLLNCSVRSTYYYIESGTIKAVNFGQRITRVKRSEIDKLFT
jgi:excisionase family DNA binding protein